MTRKESESTKNSEEKEGESSALIEESIKGLINNTETDKFAESSSTVIVPEKSNEEQLLNPTQDTTTTTIETQNNQIAIYTGPDTLYIRFLRFVLPYANLLIELNRRDLVCFAIILSIVAFFVGAFVIVCFIYGIIGSVNEFNI
ncbi:hypothetical protein EDEG_01586 [Edhazardia aedis USNM 41457]|uniref:Uncharacterized protein n=1 Tax=Edhazardia aedis (strain USNM 41457) TaxID=1003232 RepID=J9DNN9_EDHAE|nr:hypothetical protein EDEG_01586 [Edhazardia aedis USNM 41457]|eukprot:EJW04150.1 hypothetical protein EDEG_01586 [Edhazardia aedis USNM 41457]